ncbi:Cyclic nucleotide-gated potassium channel [compost metagenome]
MVPGGVICRKGEKAASMFIIVKGDVRIHPGEVTEPSVATLNAGQYFGEACLLTGQARNATAVAVQECEVLEIDRIAFKTTLASHPDIVAELSRVVSYRADQIERWRDGLVVAEPTAQAQASLMGRLLNYFELR